MKVYLINETLLSGGFKYRSFTVRLQNPLSTISKYSNSTCESEQKPRCRLNVKCTLSCNAECNSVLRLLLTGCQKK